MTIPQVEADSMNLKCLNEYHRLSLARDIKPGLLIRHLVLWHGVSTKNVKTRGELGKLHLLVHAVSAHPELQKFLGWEMSGGFLIRSRP